MSYSSLNEQQAVDYAINAGLFPQGASLEVDEIGDGNINIVYKICEPSTKKSIILKQAFPYVRCVGESWPLTLERIRIEADAMEIQEQIAPGLVPKIYHRNDDMALMVMEDLSHLGVMRGGTLEMQKYPKFAEHISTFLANMSFYTSDLYMQPEDKKKLVGQFLNPEMCRITEDLIFTDPYYDSERNNINPALREYLEKTFWKNEVIRLEAAKYKFKYITEAQSLLHGDLHTGSIFADEKETRAFDTEFSFVGPTAFDTGLLIGNILINYASWFGKDEPEEAKKDYQEYWLDSIDDIYELFEKKFLANWDKDATDIIAGVTGYREHYMRNLFVDTVAYAAIVMIRRMHGLAHNIDVDRIEDEERRRDIQIMILELAEEIMMNRENFAGIRDMTKFVRKNV